MIQEVPVKIIFRDNSGKIRSVVEKPGYFGNDLKDLTPIRLSLPQGTDKSVIFDTYVSRGELAHWMRFHESMRRSKKKRPGENMLQDWGDGSRSLSFDQGAVSMVLPHPWGPLDRFGVEEQLTLEQKKHTAEIRNALRRHQ